MFCEIESLLNQLAFDYDAPFSYVFVNFYGSSFFCFQICFSLLLFEMQLTVRLSVSQNKPRVFCGYDMTILGPIFVLISLRGIPTSRGLKSESVCLQAQAHALVPPAHMQCARAGVTARGFGPCSGQRPQLPSCSGVRGHLAWAWAASIFPGLQAKHRLWLLR